MLGCSASAFAACSNCNTFVSECCRPQALNFSLSRVFSVFVYRLAFACWFSICLLLLFLQMYTLHAAHICHCTSLHAQLLLSVCRRCFLLTQVSATSNKAQAAARSSTDANLYLLPVSTRHQNEAIGCRVVVYQAWDTRYRSLFAVAFVWQVRFRQNQARRFL